MTEWAHTFTDRKMSGRRDGMAYAVRAGLHTIGTQRAYFSVTGTIYNYGHDVGGGCIHDDILRLWPDLAPVVALHLSDDSGAPMHAVENALYWAGLTAYPEARDSAQLARHLRVSHDDAVSIVDYCADDRNSREAMTFCVRMLRAGWAREAAEAVELLDSLTI